MGTRIIASGGSGQHCALAYLRLCVLCKGFLPLSIQGEGVLPALTVFDKDRGGSDVVNAPTAANLLSTMLSPLSVNVTYIDPTPRLDAASTLERAEELFDGSELLPVLFDAQQRRVRFIEGNFGQPAVGATVYQAKRFDLQPKEDDPTVLVNRDTDYQALEHRVRSFGNQRIVHVGSTVGGTGSGVMPALMSRLVSLNESGHHMVIPLLEWFQLKGRTEETQELSSQRNTTMQQNRSSGLHYYLQSLQKHAAIVPLGYNNTMLDKTLREWDDNFNQRARESAIHLASAIVMWDFFTADSPPDQGMYAFVTTEDSRVPGVSKIGGYTLASLFDANQILLAELKAALTYMSAPPDLRNVFGGDNLDRLMVPAFGNRPAGYLREVVSILSDELRAREQCVDWLRGLDNVADDLQRPARTFKVKGFPAVKSLFQGLAPVSGSAQKDAVAVLEHFLKRASRSLKPAGGEQPKSNNRMLPDYAVEGIGPQGDPQGTVTPLADAAFLKNLYKTSQIHPRSIPSPLAVTNYLSRVCFREHEEDERIDIWMRRYELLVLGLCAGVLEMRPLDLDTPTGARFSLESIIRDSALDEDRLWKEIHTAHLLSFALDPATRVIMGATSPSTLVFPSMSAMEHWWDALEARIHPRRQEAGLLLATWCEHLKKWDDLPARLRPLWHKVLDERFASFAAETVSGEFQWTEGEITVDWNGERKDLVLPRMLNAGEHHSSIGWERIANIFGAATYYCSIEDNTERLFLDRFHRVPLMRDQENEAAFESILGLARAVVTGNHVVEDIDLLERQAGVIETIRRRLVWVDEKQRELAYDDRYAKDLEINTRDGEISVIHKKDRIIFDTRYFHGVTPSMVCVKQTVGFQVNSRGDMQFADYPVLTKYAALIDRNRTRDEKNGKPLAPEVAKSNPTVVRYTVPFVGRGGLTQIPVTIKNAREPEKPKGSLLLWPNFELPGWKAYVFYSGGNKLFSNMKFSVLMKSTSSGQWVERADMTAGSPFALTLDDAPHSELQRANADPMDRYAWSDALPRFYGFRMGGSEGGLFDTALLPQTRKEGHEWWGKDFGTTGSMIAFKNPEDKGKCLELRKDFTRKILNYIAENDSDEINVSRDLIGNGKWMPTFPLGRLDQNPAIISDLAVDQSSKGRDVPFERYNLISSSINTRHVKNQIFGNLKWNHGAERYPRRMFLTLMLIMAAADRLHINPPAAVQEIYPRISFPLRMSVNERDMLQDDYVRACHWAAQATGFIFHEARVVSESTSAAVGHADSTSEMLVADLGGATLDLWMGTTREGNFSTDSILYGGFKFLNNCVRDIEKDIRVLLQTPERDIDQGDLNVLLQRFFAERSRSEARDIWANRNIDGFKRIKSMFFRLAIEYASRFAAARLLHKYGDTSDDASPVNVQLILMGNAWKLDLDHDSFDGLAQKALSLFETRTSELVHAVKKIPLLFHFRPPMEKEHIAIGAATFPENKIADMRSTSSLKTYAGLNCTQPDELDWTSSIPFTIGTNLDFGKKYVEVSIMPDRDGDNPIEPKIPRFRISHAAYADFNRELANAAEARVYSSESGELSIKVSPFGLLLEQLIAHLNNIKEG